MSEWADLGKEALQLATKPRYSFALWVCCLLLLIAPLPKFLKLDAYRTLHGPIVGLIFLGAFVVWLVEMAILAGGKVSEYRRSNAGDRKVLGHLDSLNPREAKLLVVAVEKGAQTLTLRPDVDEVFSLISKGLMERVPDDSRMPNKPFTVPRFVWNHIRDNHVLKRIKARAESQPS